MVLVREDESSVVGVRGLQQPVPHITGNWGHWGRESQKKRDKTSHCASHGTEMQKTLV